MIIRGVYSRWKMVSLFKGIPIEKVMEQVGIDKTSMPALNMYLSPRLDLSRNGDDLHLIDHNSDEKLKEVINPEKVAFRSSDKIAKPTKEDAFSVLQQRFPEITAPGKDIPIREKEYLAKGVRLIQLTDFNREDLPMIISVANTFSASYGQATLSEKDITNIEQMQWKTGTDRVLSFKVQHYVQIQPRLEISYGDQGVVAKFSVWVE